MDIATHIRTQATESANLLRFQGWEGGGHSYDVGAYPGDVEALAERLGRETTRDERVSLEYQIRRLLDDAIVAPVL